MSEPTQCPKCGAVPTKGPNLEWTPWFACDSVGEPPCFRQSDKCRIAELTAQVEWLTKDKERLEFFERAIKRSGATAGGILKDVYDHVPIREAIDKARKP